MNWRRNSSGLRWNIFQLVLKSSRGHAPQWANGTHLADNFFILNCSCKIEITVICLWSQQACALPLVDHSNQYREFYRWFLVASIGRPERGALHVDIRLHLNSFTQLYTVPANASADVLWTLSNSAFSFGVKLFICICWITAWNSFFSILQKIQRLFALIVYRNETTRWIPFKIW